METVTFRNPRIVALALLVIIAAGLSALLALGRQEDPTITNINAVVTTVFPGADPGRVEALVSRELEEELRTIPEINVVESTSATGISIISIELNETVDPDLIEDVWTDVRVAAEDAALRFPDGAFAPTVESDTLGAYAAILSLSPTREGVPTAVVGRYAEALADELRNVPGSEFVELFGEPEEEVLIRLDPSRASALGLTADDVAAAVRAADAKGQAGRLRASGVDILVDVTGDIEALDRIRQVVLRDDGAGRITRLGEIAEISRGPREPSEAYALSDGQDAILLAVQLEEGLQVDVWMGRIEATVAEFSVELPASLKTEIVFDQSRYTAERLTEVGLNMAIGVALVVAVLFVTLGVRAALIVAAVLPLVSLATLATMNIIGLPIHQMSVTGLIVALGLLVDAAIVMTDEIRQRVQRGLSRLASVSEAVKRLAVPLLASTITTALSFTPMILLPGPAGDFVGSIAIAVVLMLGWSLIIALTITPAIAGWVLPASGSSNPFAAGVPSGWIGRRFRGTLRWSIANPVKSSMLALVLPVLGFVSFPTLTAQFFPGVERDQFHIEVELAPGTSIETTRATARRLGEILAGTEGIAQTSWAIGKSAPAFYYNIIGNRDNAQAFAQALVTTDSPETTAALLTPLQSDLNAAEPNARILVRGLVQGPPVDAPVELRLVGPNMDELRAMGEEIKGVLLGLDEVTVVRTNIQSGAPKVSVDVDEAAANLAGLTLGQISRQLEAGLEGVSAGSFLEGSEHIPVRVRWGDDMRSDLSRVSNLSLIPPRAEAQVVSATYPGIPLSAVANVSLEPAEAEITRRNGERVNTVQAFLLPGVLPEEALQIARTTLEETGFVLPDGYRMEIGGDADARNDTVNNLLASLGLIVTLSIATVVLTFNSFRLAAVTFVVAGLSAGLSILSLAVFAYPFGITAIIGVIGSIGVSINAAIIILSGLQQNQKAAAGDQEAMVDVVMGSSRHIISTTVTTFGGFLPLILGGGGFWPPFAMSVAGGVLLSTVVSFYFTPQMFALVRRRGVQVDEVQSQETDPLPTEYPELRVAAE